VYKKLKTSPSYKNLPDTGEEMSVGLIGAGAVILGLATSMIIFRRKKKI